MLLTEKQLDEFHLRGFVKAGRILDDRTIELLKEEFHKVYFENKSPKPAVLKGHIGQTYDAKEPNSPRYVERIVNLWELSEPFLEHARNPEITETVSRLCNHTDKIRIWHDQLQYKPPKIGGPTNWHQDHPAWPIIVPADLVSAWTALDDAVIENGCMWMVPGSHRWGRIGLKTGPNFEVTPLPDESVLPPGVQIKPEPLIVKKGEVAFHHCMTWHGSPNNYSDLHRRAIAVHYMPGYTIYKPTGTHVMEKYVTVKPGEVLQGESFPLVYHRQLQKAAVAMA